MAGSLDDPLGGFGKALQGSAGPVLKKELEAAGRAQPRNRRRVEADHHPRQQRARQAQDGVGRCDGLGHLVPPRKVRGGGSLRQVRFGSRRGSSLGEADPHILQQWELKLEIAKPQLARVLGGEREAEEQSRAFLEYLRRPDSLTYSTVFTVAGEKGL